MAPTAPLLSTGPSSISTPQTCRGEETTETDTEHFSGTSVVTKCDKQSGFKRIATYKRWKTFRCAATVARGVLVMRHRSAEPEVGCLALGSNSWPSWCRLNFCCPKPRALRFPLEMQRWHVWVMKSVWELKIPGERCYRLTYDQSLPSSGCSLKPKAQEYFSFPDPNNAPIMTILLTLLNTFI